MGRGENVRLLLFAKDDSQQTPRRRCFSSRNCFWFTIVQLLCLLVFFLFLVFIAIRVGQIHKNIKNTDRDQTEGATENIIPGSDFCKSVNAENMSLVALGYLKGVKEEKNAMEAKNNIYYLTDRWFTDQEACAIEALLRLLQDKSVYIIEIGNFTHTNQYTVDFVEYLRQEYTNLNHIKSAPEMFFRGSPFQNYIKSVDEFSMFAAKVLLVWQFGGTVLSTSVLLLNRRMYENNEGYCEVDGQLLFCPNQCSAYTYQLMKTILDMIKNCHEKNESLTQNSLQDIIDTSVVDYCGDKSAMRIGCVGINRIKFYKICTTLHSQCDLLKVQEWKKGESDWKKIIQKFCPKIASKFVF